MKIRDFVKRVCEIEKGKKEVNIAQVMELLKVINNLVGGWLYEEIQRYK